MVKTSAAATTPPGGPEALAGLAGLFADRTRAAICLALMDGRAWTLRELAHHAGVAASTASEHLDRLVAGGLVAERRQGRHRYLHLADHRSAELIEELVARAGPVRESGRTLRAATASAALARARTCYDHLAGRLGVAVTEAMDRRGLVDLGDGVALTDAGSAWLTEALGVDPVEMRATRRPLVRACLDWTERRTHLAGAAGAAICRHMVEQAWIRRIGSGRAVRLTPAGAAALRDLLDLEIEI